MKRLLAAVAFFFTLGASAEAAFKYVSPTGSGTTCSKALPCDLKYIGLAANAAVSAGDTIWVRGDPAGGTTFKYDFSDYPNFVFTISGTAQAPIMIQGYPGERAIIDGNKCAGNQIQIPVFEWSGSYVWFIDLEIASFYSESRDTTQTGSFPTDILRKTNAGVQTGSNSVSVGFISCVFHDMINGRGGGPGANRTNIFFIGCDSYNNGWNSTDRSHGHGDYTHNVNGWVRQLADISIGNFDQGSQFYAGSNYVHNFDVEGNFNVENGTVTGSKNRLTGGSSWQFLLGNSYVGANTQTGYIFRRNVSYVGILPNGTLPSTTNLFCYDLGLTGMVAEDNYMVAARDLTPGIASAWMWGTVAGICKNKITFNRNVIIGKMQNLYNYGSADPVPEGGTGNTNTDTLPVTNSNFLSPVPGRAGYCNVAIFNWAASASPIAIDLSGATALQGGTQPSCVLSNGNSYKIVAAGNPNGMARTSIATFTYNSGAPSVNFPITSSDTIVATPIGWGGGASRSTGPEMGVYMIFPTDGPGGPWDPQ